MNWTTDQIPTQENNIAIVTGANSGIGFETAKALAAKGATVILACRNLEKANQAVENIRKVIPNANLEIIQLDLSDLASVKSFSDTFKSKYARLDLLINNAGIKTPPFSKTKDGFESQFGSNHLGHFALTNRLLEPLRATPKARVVNVSSSAHKMAKGTIDFENLNAEKGYVPWSAYAQSKLANLLFTLELNQYFKLNKIDAISSAAHPGWTVTGLQKGFMNFISQLLGQQTAMGALPTLYAATSGDTQANDYIGPEGMMEMRGYPKKVVTSAAAQDTTLARKLWQVSEQLTGIRY